jgi:hypothetical protein
MFRGTRAAASRLEDGRLGALDLVVGLASSGRWVSQSRVVQAADGLVRSVNLTLRRLAPPQAVVVRICETVVDVEALMDDLEQELDVARRSTGVAEISGLIVVRATSSNRRQITKQVSASDPRFQASGSR